MPVLEQLSDKMKLDSITDAINPERVTDAVSYDNIVDAQDRALDALTKTNKNLVGAARDAAAKMPAAKPSQAKKVVNQYFDFVQATTDRNRKFVLDVVSAWTKPAPKTAAKKTAAKKTAAKKATAKKTASKK